VATMAGLSTTAVSVVSDILRALIVVRLSGVTDATTSE
jgi:hypothetical protein